MPTQSTVEKAFEYVKNTVLITFMSVATVVTSVLGVKGWKILKSVNEAVDNDVKEILADSKETMKKLSSVTERADRSLESIEKISKDLEEPIKTLNDVTKTLSNVKKALTTKEKPKTKKEGPLWEIVDMFIEKDNDGHSMIENIKDCVNSITKIIKDTSKSMNQKIRTVKVQRDKFPYYFKEEDKENSKEMEMNVIEYAMYQINMALGELTAPALDDQGVVITKQVNGKDVQQMKISNIIDNISSMVQEITKASSDGSIGERVAEYISELSNYEQGEKILEEMIIIAKKNIQVFNQKRSAYNNNWKNNWKENDFINELKKLNDELNILKNNKKLTIKSSDKSKKSEYLQSCFSSEGEIVIDKTQENIRDYEEHIKLVEEQLTYVRYIDVLQKFVDNKLSEDCTKEGGRYDIMKKVRSEAIEKFTSDYLKREKLNSPVGSIVFQLMISISRIRQISFEVDFKQIMDILKSSKFCFALNNKQ